MDLDTYVSIPNQPPKDSSTRSTNKRNKGPPGSKPNGKQQSPDNEQVINLMNKGVCLCERAPREDEVAFQC